MTIDDFKNWMNDSKFKSSKKDKLVGTHVESKLNVNSLLQKVTTEQDLNQICREFKKYGGNVLKVFYDDMVLVEVHSGKLTIHKYFLKKEEDYYD